MRRNVKRSSRKQVINSGYYCIFCGEKPSKENKSVDHIVPRSQGGSDHFDNLAMSCKKCNSRKGARTWVLPRFHSTTGERLSIAEVKMMVNDAMAVTKDRIAK